MAEPREGADAARAAAAANDAEWEAVQRRAATAIAARFDALRPRGGDGFFEALARH
jgi:hypothetical protein